MSNDLIGFNSPVTRDDRNVEGVVTARAGFRSGWAANSSTSAIGKVRVPLTMQAAGYPFLGTNNVVDAVFDIRAASLPNENLRVWTLGSNRTITNTDPSAQMNISSGGAVTLTFNDANAGATTSGTLYTISATTDYLFWVRVRRSATNDITMKLFRWTGSAWTQEGATLTHTNGGGLGTMNFVSMQLEILDASKSGTWSYELGDLMAWYGTDNAWEPTATSKVIVVLPDGDVGSDEWTGVGDATDLYKNWNDPVGESAATRQGDTNHTGDVTTAKKQESTLAASGLTTETILGLMLFAEGSHTGTPSLGTKRIGIDDGIAESDWDWQAGVTTWPVAAGAGFGKEGGFWYQTGAGVPFTVADVDALQVYAKQLSSQATVAYRGLCSGSWSSGSSGTIDKPTSTADGDIIIIALTAETATTVTPPAGFTEILNVAGGGTGAHVTYVYWKRASGEPANWSFGFSPNCAGLYIGAAYSNGASSGNPIDSFASASDASAPYDAPDLSVGVNGCMLVSIGEGDDDFRSFGINNPFSGGSYPSGMTGRTDLSGNNVVLGLADLSVNSGSTGAKTWTPDTDPGGGAGINLAIKPDAPVNQRWTIASLTLLVAYEPLVASTPLKVALMRRAETQAFPIPMLAPKTLHNFKGVFVNPPTIVGIPSFLMNKGHAKPFMPPTLLPPTSRRPYKGLLSAVAAIRRRLAQVI